VDIEDWNRFVREAFNWESEDPHLKLSFKKLTRNYGLAYIEYCKAAWAANDG
jgi:hypothetical protein